MTRIVTTAPLGSITVRLEAEKLSDGSESFEVALFHSGASTALRFPLTGWNEMSALAQFEQLVTTINTITP